MDFYSKQVQVLYAEDEKEVREGFARTLKRFTKEQYVASDGEQALELYKTYMPDIVITDIKMPNKNGIELAEEILQINPEQVIIFTTAHTESKYTLKALGMQAEAYMVKPINKNNFKIKLNSIAKNILAKRENIRNQKIIQAILDSRSSILVLTDFNDIEYASKSFFKLFNLNNKDEFFKKYDSFMDIFKDKDECIYEKDKNSFLEKFNNVDEAVVCLKENDGIYQINIDKLDFNDTVLYVVSFTDITTIHEEKSKALYESFHDKLTSSYNKSMFNKLLDKEYKMYLRYKRPFCLAIFDIDFFKNINDSYGHLVGDEVLKLLSSFFMNNIRETDIFARWGGEEFTLLMRETEIKEAKKVCEKFRKQVEEMRVPYIPSFTISAGLVQIDENDSQYSLFQKADDALYVAKNSGRNKISIYGIQ